MAELLQQQGGALRGKRVLELGAGTGIGGLSAAACGAHVLLSDQAHMLPLLNENIAANGHMLQWRDAEAEAEGGAASAATADGRTDSAAGRTEGDFCGSGSAVATQLLWGDESDLERVGASGPFDLVVGCWPAHALACTPALALAPTTSPHLNTRAAPSPHPSIYPGSGPQPGLTPAPLPGGLGLALRTARVPSPARHARCALLSGEDRGTATVSTVIASVALLSREERGVLMPRVCPACLAYRSC